MNRSLQHLSYDRITYLAERNRQWRTDCILSELGGLCRRFLVIMPEERWRWLVPNGGDPGYFPLEDLADEGEREHSDAGTGT